MERTKKILTLIDMYVTELSKVLRTFPQGDRRFEKIDELIVNYTSLENY
ncbi:hypothetical protein [Clostridium sp. ATCC 25772]|nr:hypothetical protein [Clostridium sp. ATCC 25772]